ncbi:MAG TPA: M48 family metalloprotease [Solirubrobacteraceae bacterium]|nr:M48 family metalloprotease [Solirubrobacteraceae bacterium]
MRAELPSGLIRPAQLHPGWLALYALTLAVNLLCAGVRSGVCYALLWLAFTILGLTSLPVHLLALILGYGPLALSVATLILPLGGWWWQQREGGRSPSERERLIYADALSSLAAAGPTLALPRRWFVLDLDAPNAAVYADTLLVTRGLLESRWLTAVLAHELGHLASSDGRLAAALHRCTVPPRRLPARLRERALIGGAVRVVAFLATGELAMWLLRGPWGVYWRSREHAADHYAATLGQADLLAEYLDLHALASDIPVPFVWLTSESHPPTEHRIDRLSRDQAQAAQTINQKESHHDVAA